jgi:beta-phosphoglucomutase-like phosphatase (HAD superfamily)
LPKAAIFDLDGTLLDSVDLHALAWQEAVAKFGRDLGFEQARIEASDSGAYKEEAYGLPQYRQSAEEPRAKVRIALSDEAT